MDERFLHESRREPDPGFARSLRARLRAIEAEDEERATPWWRPALALAAALAVCAALFTLPAVRATAQNVLDLFRVHDFAVVQIDAQRVEQLKAKQLDPQTLLGGKVDKLQEPGPPQRFASIEQATPAAGFTPARPTELPRGVTLDSVFVTGEVRSRVTVDTKPLRDLMESFDIRDLSLPAGLDGQQVAIHVPRAMAQRYQRGGHRKVTLFQATSPEVSLPAGVDIARLGEIGLRILGLDRGEASRLARSIDWRSTLLVPVTSSATTFQQLTINGAHGVYIESTRARGDHTDGGAGDDDGPGAVVMWSRDDRIYALAGDLPHQDLVAMAESVR